MADPDARRRAEEALRRVLANAAAIVRLSWSDGATAADRANLERIKSAAADIAQDHKILRALLAAGPEAKAPREYGPCPNYREGQSHAGCNLCGGLGTLPILSDADIAPPPPSDAVAAPKAARPKGDIWDACGCPNPDDCEHVFYEPAPSDAAVREAAEVVRTILTAHDARLSESGVLTYGPPSKGTGFVAAIQWLRRYDAARGGE